jgi:hypothetical protein
VKSICLSAVLTVAVLIVVPDSLATAAPLPGWTLSYKVTSGQKISRTVAARTRRGRIAILGLGRRRVYEQYDGRRFWVCVQGKKCRVAARGAGARKTADFLNSEFFDPYAKHGLASVFMTDPKPAGHRVMAGVASTCKRSSDAIGHGPPDLLCTADRGGFLTLLEAGDETYALHRAVPRVASSFLAIPRGTWDGRL